MCLGSQGPPEITQGADMLTTYKSSEWGERCFCSKCGTNLFTNAPDYGYFGVSAGVLEDEDQKKLSMNEEIFIDKKPSYYSLEGGGWPRLTEAEFQERISGGSPTEEDK